MSVSMFDATVESAHPGRSRAELSTFDQISFRLLDGSLRTVKNAVARPPIADQLRPGNKARFYLFEGMERRGIHGVRYPNGWVIYDYPDANAKILRVFAALGLAWVLLNFVIEHEISFIGFAVFALSAGAYAVLKQREREAEWQVGSDYGFVRTVPMLPPPERSATSSAWVPLVERVEPVTATRASETIQPASVEPDRTAPEYVKPDRPRPEVVKPDRAEPVAEPELVEPQVMEESREEPSDVIELPGPQEAEPEPAKTRVAATAK